MWISSIRSCSSGFDPGMLMKPITLSLSFLSLPLVILTLPIHGSRLTCFKLQPSNPTAHLFAQTVEATPTTGHSLRCSVLRHATTICVPHRGAHRRRSFYPQSTEDPHEADAADGSQQQRHDQLGDGYRCGCRRWRYPGRYWGRGVGYGGRRFAHSGAPISLSVSVPNRTLHRTSHVSIYIVRFLGSCTYQRSIRVGVA